MHPLLIEPRQTTVLDPDKTYIFPSCVHDQTLHRIELIATQTGKPRALEKGAQYTELLATFTIWPKGIPKEICKEYNFRNQSYRDNLLEFVAA